MDFASNIEEVESRVRSLAPLVKRIAKHIAASVPNSVDQDSLVQAGMAGLFGAARRYHAGPGADFDAFAVPLIRREMIESLRGSASLPSDARQGMRDVEAVMERLQRQKGRPPTEKEVAVALGISLDEYSGLLRSARGYQIVSYDDRDAETEAGAQTADDIDPLEALNDPKLRERVIAAIEALPDREKLVMSLYHEHRMNPAEIAAVLGVSEARALELYTQSIARIRVAIRKA